MDELPTEIIFKLFDFLTEAKDFLSLSSTCKRILSISSNYCLKFSGNDKNFFHAYIPIELVSTAQIGDRELRQFRKLMQQQPTISIDLQQTVINGVSSHKQQEACESKSTSRNPNVFRLLEPIYRLCKRLILNPSNETSNCDYLLRQLFSSMETQQHRSTTRLLSSFKSTIIDTVTSLVIIIHNCNCLVSVDTIKFLIRILKHVSVIKMSAFLLDTSSCRYIVDCKSIDKRKLNYLQLNCNKDGEIALRFVFNDIIAEKLCLCSANFQQGDHDETSSLTIDGNHKLNCAAYYRKFSINTLIEYLSNNGRGVKLIEFRECHLTLAVLDNLLNRIELGHIHLFIACDCSLTSEDIDSLPARHKSRIQYTFEWE